MLLIIEVKIYNSEWIILICLQLGDRLLIFGSDKSIKQYGVMSLVLQVVKIGNVLFLGLVLYFCFPLLHQKVLFNSQILWFLKANFKWNAVFCTNTHAQSMSGETCVVTGLPAALPRGVISVMLPSEVSAHNDKGTGICECPGNWHGDKDSNPVSKCVGGCVGEGGWVMVS